MLRSENWNEGFHLMLPGAGAFCSGSGILPGNICGTQDRDRSLYPISAERKETSLFKMTKDRINHVF